MLSAVSSGQGFFLDVTFSESGFSKLQRSLVFISFFIMSSDSVLDAIVSAAEAMTVIVTTRPSRSGAGSAALSSTRLLSRQGGGCRPKVRRP